MRNTLFLIASIVAAVLSSAPVQAQWSNYGNDDGLIRCESRDGRTERCETYGGDVQLVRQLSGNACVRGRTWGTDSRGVWVSSGCRAEFRVGNGYDYDDNNSYGSGYGNDYGYGSSDGLFRCESRTGRTERCNAYGGRVQFIRQLSNTPCVRGQSWGNDSRGVWVSNGCRALFSADDRYGNGYNHGNGYGNSYGNRNGNDLVRCESRDNRSHNCVLSAGRNGNIRLLRQLSDKPCIENQTWGRTRSGVWVTQGCRAEFVTGRGGNNGGSQRPPGDLGGGLPGGKRPGVFEDASERQPGDLGGAVITPTSQRPSTEERRRPVESPRFAESVGRPQSRAVEEAPSRIEARPVQEAPGRIQVRPVEDAPGRIQSRPAEEAPGRVEQGTSSGIAEPEALRLPRGRDVQQGDQPR